MLYRESVRLGQPWIDWATKQFAAAGLGHLVRLPHFRGQSGKLTDLTNKHTLVRGARGRRLLASYVVILHTGVEAWWL